MRFRIDASGKLVGSRQRDRQCRARRALNCRCPGARSATPPRRRAEI